ncbi:aminoglycoside phosphotransferase family protein [Sphaerisporangium sp. NPDC051017]|uniref:phosphotransferase family protein n=1 Tax=Sphaerisporangium sp. NPDC051017 TaxID=3154636 RepID=UPI0034334320
MTGTSEETARAMLREACAEAGLDATGATLVRQGENTIYRLPGGVIARVSRPGQVSAAAREVSIARWLEASGVPAVQVLPDVVQPVDVGGRAVTFWRELPPHRHGTAVQVATALRRLHDLAIPSDIDITPLDPFVRLTDRIDRARTLLEDDRAWMRAHLKHLMERYADLPPGRSLCVVHGDAWVGNVVSTDGGEVVLLDLERSSVGPPEWDLVSTAVKAFTLGGIPVEDYRDFVGVYGYDVTAWEGFEILRDIREFRMTCMAAQVAAENPTRRDEADRRLASLRGWRGSRPWTDWRPVP